MKKEIKETEKEETKKVGAKKMSAFAMLFSSLWVAFLTILKGLGMITLDVDEIIYSGLAITAMWSPTFISIYFDKIKILKDTNK